MENNTNLDPETRVAEGQGEGAKTHKRWRKSPSVCICVLALVSARTVPYVYSIFLRHGGARPGQISQFQKVAHGD
jgi:hypothetical protein